MALVKCIDCGQRISSNAKSCPHCGNPIKKSYVGWLLGILALLVIAVMVAAMATYEEVPPLPGIEIAKLTGLYTSNTDPRWEVRIAEAPSSGSADGGWNAKIWVYAPEPDLAGSFRCRISGDHVFVEYPGGSARMFKILDENSLTYSLSADGYFPGTLTKQ